MAESYRGSAASRGYGYRWQKARLGFLGKEENALCVYCKKAGRVVAATVVNHRIPHRGDMKLFWDRTNWEPVCKPHHDGLIQSFEKSGRMKGNDTDGRPTDPSHPWNRPRSVG
jgi:5-methylcytosine-specific restriction protein A